MEKALSGLSYFHSGDLDTLKRKCDRLLSIVEEKDETEKCLRSKLHWLSGTKNKLQDLLQHMQHKKILSACGFSFLSDRFSMVDLDLLKTLVSCDKKTGNFSTATAVCLDSSFLLTPCL